MPITAHPDIWSLNSSRYFLAEQGKWNVYDYLNSLPSTHPIIKNYGENYFTYPPLSYLTFGLFSFLLKPFYTPDPTLEIMSQYPDIYQLASVKKILFLFKLPYLFFDFGVAFLLTKLFDQEKDKKRAFLLWVFNPVSLYSTYMVGQFEIMPVFFVVLALFLARQHKPYWAAASLGIGGAFKMFPLFFLPILAVVLGKNFWQKLKLALAGLLPFFITILPFVNSPNFRQKVLFSSQSQKFLHMTLPVSGAEGIYIFVFVWGLIFFSSYYSRSKQNLWFYFMAVMLAFFSVTHYHPQWFVWLTPFLAIQLIKAEFLQSFLVVFLCSSWLVITFFFESSLNYGLFVPLFPSLLNTPSLAEVVKPFYDIFQLKSIIRSLFAAASFIIIFYSLKIQNKMT